MLNVIFWVFSVICTVFGLHYAAISILGGFKKLKPKPKHAPQKRIAAIIAARNEESVIANLVDSLLKQNYPKELYDVYVVPNNCTDDTEGVARRAGAKILDCTVPVSSKGEVLAFTFDQLLEGKDEYDGFCIFDADNLVHPDFFAEVNAALCNGKQVGQGYRDSKNPDDSWVSGCVSIFYWGMSRLYNHARSNLGFSAALNGTGFMVSADVIREYGWNTISLTEDLEFTAQCALRGIEVAWMEDAIIYDEQPLKLMDSYVQRRRWSAGTFQCMNKYFKDLMATAFKKRSFACLDMAILFSGPVMQLICFVPFAIVFLQMLSGLILGSVTWLQMILWMLSGLGIGILFGVLFAVLVCILEKKWDMRKIPAVLGMPIFMATWIPANLASLFLKVPKWKPIPHVSTVGIDRLHEKKEN